jgi:hypothetical protein
MFRQQGISMLRHDQRVVPGCGRPDAPDLVPAQELVLESDYIQSDETTIPIINNESTRR